MNKGGRPQAPPEDKKHVYAVRLNLAQIGKLQKLGMDWLRRAIDRAKLPPT